MQVGVLGPLIVRVDDHDVTPRGQRLRDVFVVLLQRRGRPVPAEVILDLVWADDAMRRNVSVVHTVVARLRRLLGPAAITSHNGGYLLERTTATDEDAFTELVAMARGRLGADEDGLACDDYRRALAEWRGLEPFEGVRPELVEADRARLTDLRAAAIEELAALRLEHQETGGPAEALELTADLISSRPLRENPYQLAMLAAYRCHRQADALAIYQTLQRLLRSELGIEPTPAAAQLYSMILRQDRQLDATQPAPAALSRRQPVGATRLPAPVSPLIGRVGELTRLLAGLANGQRLITLVGPGGVGKSRLLIELGARQSRPKGLLYVGMSGLDSADPNEVAEAIVVGHGVLDGYRPPLESLTAALADQPWLLLIDEAEWAIESLAPVVTSILESCPGVQIVVTSRIPLDVAGESLVTIEPLTLPHGDADTAAIFQAPAVEFLVRRLADRAVLVDADRATAQLLTSIASRVDGLPLALELAAGQASGRSLADIALLVESPLDVPATGMSENVRHRSLRHTLEWSMARLEPDHRTVLRRLSVYVGGFDLADAAAVAGPIDSVGEIVRSLARDALIHVERSSASRLTFRLLRTVRDLASEGLDAHELASTAALHRHWHAGLSRGASADLVSLVREKLDDYLEALRTAVESRDATTLADLTLALVRFWQFMGGQAVGLRWIGRVLDSDVLSSGERARLQAQRAALALHHDPPLVLADTALAIPLLEAAGDTASSVAALVTALSVRAFELYAQGRSAEAGVHADRAVSMARTGSADLLAGALATAGLIHAVTERVELAGAAIDEARDHLDALPASAGRTATGSVLTLALVNLERFTDALEVSDSVTPTDQPPPRYLLARGWAGLGSGRNSLALQCFARSIPAEGPQPADRQSVETVLGAGCVLAAIGHPSAAWALAGGLELVGRVDYLTPPALDRAIDRAREQVAHQEWPDCSMERTTALLRRLERNLTTVAEELSSADSRSAAG